MDVIFSDIIDNGLVRHCKLNSMQLKTRYYSISCINRNTVDTYPHQLAFYLIVNRLQTLL